MAMSHAAIRAAVRGLPIELPSWGFANAGTRFGAFPEPGAARLAMSALAAGVGAVLGEGRGCDRKRAQQGQGQGTKTVHVASP